MRNKTPSNVQSTVCLWTFSIYNGGKTDIDNHVQSQVHKSAVNTSVLSDKLTSYFNKASFDNEQNLQAAAEGPFATTQ